MRRILGIALLMVMGCATSGDLREFAAVEHLCVHCNCLMPAGTDPESTCTVCNCGKRARQCVLR